jgi:hypothetical protein
VHRNGAGVVAFGVGNESSVIAGAGFILCLSVKALAEVADSLVLGRYWSQASVLEKS